MKIKPVFYAKFDQSKITFYDPKGLNKYLKSLNDGEIQMLIEKRKRTRSNRQNRYYWGCVIPLLCEAFGWIDNEGPEEMHEYLKYKFLAKKRYIKIFPGAQNELTEVFSDAEEEVATTRSTTSLTTVEFEDYMLQIRQWASLEHGVYIPEPNEPSIQSIYF